MTAFVLAACGGDSSAPTSTSSQAPRTSPPSAAETRSALPRIGLPVEKGDTVEGLVDVDGHDIYARCNGTGSPTVLYFTGWADDESKQAVDVIQGVEAVDQGKHRICSYERRNTGRSDSMKGTQAPEDIVADVDGVLTALGEEGPYVLLGASFGGAVASAYAVSHPGRTAAILLLDSSIPDEYLFERRHGFQGACLAENRHADAWESLEKIDNCRLAKWVYARRDREPDVPLIYLAAEESSAAWSAEYEQISKAFVRRWSPGILETVDAPHWMDEADPELVVKNLERVIALRE